MVLFAAVVEFAGNATIGLPWWANTALATVFLVGCIALVVRSRSISDVEIPEPDTAVDDEVSQADADTPPERPDVWRVVEHSVRQSGVVSGEGPVVLMGYAEVTETRGDRKLYHCSLFDVPRGHQYVELRVGTSSVAGLLRREVKITLDPGNILWSELTWTPEDHSAEANVVANADTVLTEALELLDGAERMVVVWKDTIEDDSGRTTPQGNRIVVGLEGFSDVMSALRIQAWRVRSASPAPL